MLYFVILHLCVFPEVSCARLLYVELVRLHLSLRLYLREFECAAEVGCLILLYAIPFLTTRVRVMVHHRQRRLIFAD
jgi:hypothetical protein